MILLNFRNLQRGKYVPEYNYIIYYRFSDTLNTTPFFGSCNKIHQTGCPSINSSTKRNWKRSTIDLIVLNIQIRL